ncbi:MAG TPA: tetratricopeptide repeat protein [Gemmatimonadaceae bacterium]|nr:tetratricopeptide repeat protein [Gemmatimonadaceae bacterium]
MARLNLLGRVALSADDTDAAVSLAPKPLGLLAYVSLAGHDGAPLRRDTLLMLFWPELSDTNARGALRQALFQIRRAVGSGAVASESDDSLRFDAASLWCDATAFESAIEAGDRQVALELYRGDLLAGFYCAGLSAELEEWFERRRARLKAAAARGARELAASAPPLHAVRYAERALELQPDDECAVRLLIGALDALGDRTGALRAAAEFTDRMAREYETVPSPETRSLIAAVRVRGEVPVAITPSPPPPAPPPLTVTPPRRWRTGRAMLALAIGAGIAAFVVSTGDSGQRPPLGLTIASPVTRRFFFEGLTRFERGDMTEAEHLLSTALAEDSSCAICAYYIARTKRDERIPMVRAMETAVRLANRASPYERLLIRYAWADVVNDPARVALAESLTVQYPMLPEGEYSLGQSLILAGRYLDAIPHLARAWHLDSVAARTDHSPCRACDAPGRIIDAYWAADSLDAATRFAIAWVRASGAPLAWDYRSQALAREGRYADARAALDSAMARDLDHQRAVMARVQLDIRAGDFDNADALLEALRRSGNTEQRTDALWWRVYSLRNQGRLHEALDLAQGPLRWEMVRANAFETVSLIEGATLLENGRAEDARTLYRSLAAPQPTDAEFPGLGARRRAWPLVHAGTASGVLGDTVDLAALADALAGIGRQSGFGRDVKLHEYVRGLLWLARGRPGDAVLALRRSIFSYTDGYTRENFVLGNALLRLGRPAEAVAVFSAALAGADDASALYVTRTELHEALARAFEALGQADSATIHYRAVADAWRHADAPLRERGMAARRAIAHLASAK